MMMKLPIWTLKILLTPSSPSFKAMQPFHLQENVSVWTQRSDRQLSSYSSMTTSMTLETGLKMRFRRSWSTTRRRCNRVSWAKRESRPWRLVALKICLARTQLLILHNQTLTWHRSLWRTPSSLIHSSRSRLQLMKTTLLWRQGTQARPSARAVPSISAPLWHSRSTANLPVIHRLWTISSNSQWNSRALAVSYTILIGRQERASSKRTVWSRLPASHQLGWFKTWAGRTPSH